MQQTIFDKDLGSLMAKASDFVAAELERFSNREMILGVPGGRSAAELYGALQAPLAALPIGTRRWI